MLKQDEETSIYKQYPSALSPPCFFLLKRRFDFRHYISVGIIFDRLKKIVFQTVKIEKMKKKRIGKTLVKQGNENRGNIGRKNEGE